MLSHCHHTAQIASQYRNTVDQKRLRGAGAHLPPLSGGLQVSLDLSQTFDLISVILELHGKATYHTSVKEHKGCILTSNGIRQGCTLAPSFWFLLSCYIYRRLACVLRPNTIQHLTLCADDHDVYADVRSLSGLATPTAELGKLLHHLQRHSLAVSPGKSIALLMLKGKYQTKAFKRRVYLKANQRLLLITSGEGSVGQPQTVPIANSCSYLGVQISYTRAAELTAQHNMRTATQRFNALRSLLTGRHTLSLQQRVRLWRACVLPILTHALHSCDGTAAARGSETKGDITSTAPSHCKVPLAHHSRNSGPPTGQIECS